MPCLSFSKSLAGFEIQMIRELRFHMLRAMMKKKLESNKEEKLTLHNTKANIKNNR